MKRGDERADGILGAVRAERAAGGAKMWAGREAAPFFAALVAIGLSLPIYRAWPELGFAATCSTSAAAGWLLSRRSVELVCVAEAGVLAASVWSGSLPWWAAAIQFAVAVGLAALAHLAAEGTLSRRLNGENERHLRGMTFLLETAEFLATTTDQAVILNAAVHASARGISRAGKTGSAHAAFHEVIGEFGRIALVDDEPRHQVLATGFEYPLVRNQAARAAIRTGRPAIVRPDHLSGSLRTLAEDLGWEVLIMAPVYSNGSIRGLLAATGRDGPAVEQLQQFMLGRLARFTSASLESAAARHPSMPATTTAVDARPETDLPEGVKEESDNMVRVTVGATDKLDDLIAQMATQAAIDRNSGLMTREYGLAALERDMRRSRRAQARGQCLAVLRMPASHDPNAGDQLIRLVVDRLRSQLRQDDLIFRYADDEIVCWFGDVQASDMQTILNRVQSDLAREVGYLPFAIGLTPVKHAQSAS